MVAGFCWPWSNADGDAPLPRDVEIGAWRRPWNRKPPEMMGGTTPPPHRHPYTLWATTDAGLDEVGCIYSVQGFEFDYVGVIWGDDLVWRAESGWVGQPNRSYDSVVKRAATDNPQKFTRLLSHTYKVLLSRGMVGMRVVCLDDETKAHLETTLGRTNQVV